MMVRNIQDMKDTMKKYGDKPFMTKAIMMENDFDKAIMKMKKMIEINIKRSKTANDSDESDDRGEER